MLEPRIFWGVFGAEAPNRAARAVGNDTAVANGAGPPPRTTSAQFPRHRRGAAVSRPFGRASLTRETGGRGETGRLKPRLQRPEVRLRGLPPSHLCTAPVSVHGSHSRTLALPHFRTHLHPESPLHRTPGAVPSVRLGHTNRS